MIDGLKHILIGAALVAPGALGAQAPTLANALKPLDPTQVIALVPKVKAIKADPTTLTLHVGETVSLGRITVTVIDSAGRTAGALIGYDFAIKPGEPATAMPRQVTGVRPGTTELAILYPRSAWTARKDPRAETKVKIVVVK
jgi:hypothetical protein